MKKTMVFSLSCMLFSMALVAQDVKFKEAFLDGDYFMMYEEYADALPFYLQLYKEDPDNANICYRIGVCYINMPGQKTEAIPYLEKAVRNTTTKYRERNHRETHAPLDAYYFLGTAYRIDNQLDKATQTYERYLSLIEKTDTLNKAFVNQQIAACRNAREFMKNPVYFDAVNMGNPINDSYSNFNPLVSRDEQTMVYVTSLKFYDAIFYTEKVDGQWTAPVNLSPQVLSDGDLYPTCLSPGGDKLLLSRETDYSSELFISRKENGLWTPAERLGKNINSRYWENHACVTSDGKTLYFTSNKPGGYGGFDIYRSQWDENLGDWGLSQNLGPVINTPFNEESPFMTGDDKVLYFSSQGHKTMGGYDIFYSIMNDDGSWTSPQNLGYPINTTDDELFFFPLNGGIHAYYSKFSPDGFGLRDIFRFDIFSDKNPRNVEITGTLRLADRTVLTGVPVSVELSDDRGKLLASLEVDENTGKFSHYYREPGIYNLRFSGDGYIESGKTVELPGDYSLASVEAHALLEPEIIETIVLKAIFFGFDKAVTEESEKAKLDHLASVLLENPGLVVEIAGHTDSKGREAYNQRLSERRAAMVKNQLLKMNVPTAQLQTKGFGELKPIALNELPDGKDSPDGRKLNRRVEINIVRSDNPAIVSESIDVPEKIRIK